VSIIVKLSDGSRIRVRGVNSQQELISVLSERMAEQGTGGTEGVESVESVGYSDWRQVYNEEIRRGLCDGQRGGGGRKNEPTGKAKPQRLVNDRKWFRGGGGYDHGE